MSKGGADGAVDELEEHVEPYAHGAPGELPREPNG